MHAQRIAVTGATGSVGSHVVDVLEERGHEVVRISRSAGIDVVTGEGLLGALSGVDAVIDTAAGASPEQVAATAFFTGAAQNLQELGARAGVRRIVAVSVLGCDRFTGGYGVAKIAHELATLAGPIPARILRAAYFHEFVAQMVEWGTKDDVSYVPRMRTQLVAARTVAEELVALADGSAANGPLITKLAGPQEESLVRAAMLLVERRGDPVRIVPVRDRAAWAVYESGALLPGPNATLAGPTFEEWLDATYCSVSSVRRRRVA